MNSLPENHKLELEFKILCEEYKTLKTEINSTLISVRQALTLSLTGIGGLIAISSLVIDKNVPALFLVSSILFCLLFWNQYRWYLVIEEISLYLQQVTIPKIHKILEVNSEESQTSKNLMSWEKKFKSISDIYGHQYSMIEISDLIVPYFAALFSFCGYFFLEFQSDYSIIVFVRMISLFEKTLILLNTQFPFIQIS